MKYDFKFGDKIAIDEETAVIVGVNYEEELVESITEHGDEIHIPFEDVKVSESKFIKFCEFAEQQFTGFISCEAGMTLTDLVDAMGLEKEEWEYMKKNVPTALTPYDVGQIDNYFETIEQDKR